MLCLCVIIILLIIAAFKKLTVEDFNANKVQSPELDGNFVKVVKTEPHKYFGGLMPDLSHPLVSDVDIYPTLPFEFRNNINFTG